MLPELVASLNLITTTSLWRYAVKDRLKDIRHFSATACPSTGRCHDRLGCLQFSVSHPEIVHVEFEESSSDLCSRYRSQHVTRIRRSVKDFSIDLSSLRLKVSRLARHNRGQPIVAVRRLLPHQRLLRSPMIITLLNPIP